MRSLTILFICIINVAFAQKKINKDLAKLNLKGKVKVLHEWEQSLSCPRCVNEFTPKSTNKLRFNRRGNIKQLIGDTVNFHFLFQKKMRKQIDNKLESVYKYNKEGKCILFEVYQNKTRMIGEYTTYNSNGNIGSIKYETTTNAYNRIDSLKYDAYNNLIEVNIIDSYMVNNQQKNTQGRITYDKYDSNKNWRLSIKYHEGKVVSTINREIKYFK